MKRRLLCHRYANTLADLQDEAERRGMTFREAMTEAAVQWIKASKRKRPGPPVRYRLEG